jgi:hypothetical protein
VVEVAPERINVAEMGKSGLNNGTRDCFHQKNKNSMAQIK